jgi:hypothetical protein
MIRFLNILVAAIVLVLAHPSHAAGLSWVWSTKNPGGKDRVCFRRDFEVPAQVVSANVSSSADNWHRVWINGTLLGEHRDWPNTISKSI